MNAKQLDLSIVAGHAVECFDATLYGFYAVWLAPYFFPPETPQLLLSFGAFAAGFLVRPLGALCFGFLGDRFGRKKPLTLAMALVGIPTLIMGLIPSYHAIGIWSPILLYFCRAAQGFFYGAEFAGVSVYTYENYKDSGRAGRQTGLLLAAGYLGAVLATLSGVFLPINPLASQLWRAPFVVGGVAAFVVFFMRKCMKETPDFERARSEKTLVFSPTKELWRYRREVLMALVVVGTNTVALYMVTVFGNQLFKKFGYSASQSMLLNMSTLVLYACMNALYGRWVDRFGARNFVLSGSLWIVGMAFPGFYVLTSYPSLMGIYGFMLLMSIGNAMVVVASMLYISSFFPTHCRFSAVALSSTLGYALIGGSTPAVAHYLQSVTSCAVAPAFWLVATSGMALVCIVWIEHKKKKCEGDKIVSPLDFVTTD